MRVAPTLLIASGLIVMGIGLYFIFFRPPLLPEDVRYIGGTMESIRAGAPELAAWLGKVFLVMGGYVLATGVLTSFIGVVLFRSPLPGAWATASFAGMTSVGLMAMVNFALDSDFKWYLFALALLWTAALLAALFRAAPAIALSSGVMFPLHHESVAVLNAPVAEAFEYLDDFKQLSAHMEKSSAMMMGSRMRIELDERSGHAVGSRVRMTGKMMGLTLSLEEVVTDRLPPFRKSWQTVDTNLVVIGSYRLGFELTPDGNASRARIFIDYALPAKFPARWLGILFAGTYARWCTGRMAMDVERYFSTKHRPGFEVGRR
jgi:Polyketide cyclase / dehydrase and lipid transport